jgi:hypothetical protein
MQGYGEIYKITSPSQKVYIGQAVCYLSNGKSYGTFQRWNGHIRDAHRPSGGNCRRLNFAIRKYGADNFIVQQLLTTKLEYLDYYEMQMIQVYNATDMQYGYNLRESGNKSKLALETRQLMSVSQTGDKNHNFGKSKPVEICKQISETLINNVIRKGHHDGVLPKYIKYVDWKDRKGYAVVSHPHCKIKYFVSSKTSLEDNYAKCVEYLQSL